MALDMPLVFKKSKSFRSLIRVGGLIGRSCASSVIFYSGLLSAVVLECCGFGVVLYSSTISRLLLQFLFLLAEF